jgi:electron transfer flavoprotein alpha subunit
MEGRIVIFGEERGGTLRKASLEVLSRAGALRDEGSVETFLVLVGKDVQKALDKARGYADYILPVARDPETLGVDLLVSFLKDRLEGSSLLFAFSSATPLGLALLAGFSTTFSVPFISQAIDMKVEGGKVLFKKPLFGGRIFVWLEAERPVAVAFRPNTFPVRAMGLEGRMVEEEFYPEEDGRVRTVSVEEREKKGVSLEEADVVICGGLGMKEARNFLLLEEIAEALGGAVGASRGAVDAGLRPYEDQIGKSGKTVSPKVYIGCGVSGAIHHIMGMDTSRVVIAINRDDGAPIFRHANYGIVGDLFEILPLLREELKRSKP